MVEPVTTTALFAGGSQVLGGLMGDGGAPTNADARNRINAFTGEFNPIFGQTPVMSATASIVPVAVMIAIVAGVWAVVRK